MKPLKIKDSVYWLGSIDWDRRLFDSLIPLPDGTSYNAYLVEGSEKTALLDTVDLPMQGELMEKLSGVSKIDFIILSRNSYECLTVCSYIPAEVVRYIR